MIQLSFIAQEAYENLENDKIEITPLSFQEEYCKLVHAYGLEHADCQKFHHIVSTLGEFDEERFSLKSIKNIYELSEKLFEKIQQDQEIISKNTQDISKLIQIINSHVMDAIVGNKAETNKIIAIKQEMEQIEFNGNEKENLQQFKTKLVNAADNIELHMNNVNSKLEESGKEVDLLRQKIEDLEEELHLVKEENQKDHLTGVLTRGSYEKLIGKFEQEFLNLEQDYALIFIDLDYFKHINDTFGHDGGDFILKTFGQILLRLTRESNVIGRYGGEEFVVGFKYFSEDEIVKYLKRMQDIIHSKQFVYQGKKISLTFSAGVALRSSFTSYEESLKEADENVYKAKRDGRNRIILPFEPFCI